jgi:hypothetical protein
MKKTISIRNDGPISRSCKRQQDTPYMAYTLTKLWSTAYLVICLQQPLPYRRSPARYRCRILRDYHACVMQCRADTIERIGQPGNEEGKFPKESEGDKERTAAGRSPAQGFSPVLQPSAGWNACIHKDKVDSCNQNHVDDRVPTH